MLKPLCLDHDVSWKERYRLPVMHTSLARAVSTRGLVISNHTGTSQLYAWDIPTGYLHQLTQHQLGVSSGIISSNGRYVYFLDDSHGNEIGHYVCLPFEGGVTEDITPHLPPYSSQSFYTSFAGNMLGFTIANQDGFHSYTMPITLDGTPAELQLLYTAKNLCYGPVLSYSGEIAIIATTEQSGSLNYCLYAFHTADGSFLNKLSDGPTHSIRVYSCSGVKSDPRVLVATNRSGVLRPFLWHVGTGERIDLQIDELIGEVIPLDWSNDGSQILLCQIHAAKHQLYCYHIPEHTLSTLPSLGGTYTGAYFGPDNNVFAHWQDSTHAPRLIALSTMSESVQCTVLPYRDGPANQKLHSVQFPSSDGQVIQGWLGIPAGTGPFPTIIETHGGPATVVTDRFSPDSQTWIDHGFVYLSINYRGSTTFGKAFEQQIWGNLGYWEVEDMVAARAWLVQSEIAHPQKIILVGGSYGGYLTLQALGRYPDKWAGGIAALAITDWTILYEDCADTIKEYVTALFGATPTQKPNQYAASSPITYAHNVRAPVLIIQGRNDSRCPARAIQQYEAKLKELNTPITVHWFEAGHGLRSVEQSIMFRERMLCFTYAVLNDITEVSISDINQHARGNTDSPC